MWPATTEPNIHNLFRFSLPFTYGFSKNHIYSLSGQGHIHLRGESRDIKQAIALKVQQITKDAPLVNGKVWVDILVQKPNHRGDAINVVDLVCDGLKIGLGIDDRWFSIRRLDWEIVKVEPKIYIGFGQENITEQRICSYCGQSREVGEFQRHKRVCEACCPPRKAARAA